MYTRTRLYTHIIYHGHMIHHTFVLHTPHIYTIILTLIHTLTYLIHLMHLYDIYIGRLKGKEGRRRSVRQTINIRENTHEIR